MTESIIEFDDQILETFAKWKDRWKKRQMNRQTGRVIDKRTDKQKEGERQRERCTYWQTVRLTDGLSE